jgi:SAM-dependent methyltransferase
MSADPTPDPGAIRETVRRLYAEISRSGEGKFSYPTGRAGAEALGYDPADLEALPPEVVTGFCGVGNPFALGPIEEGESLLDIGCGAGLDLLIASRRVGPSGKVEGIDLTPEMAARAAGHLRLAGAGNARVRDAASESIPFPPGSFDVVISNGVFNLSPEKESTFAEVLRVLRPGGRLQFADIVRRADLPPELAGSLDAWSQ